MTIEEYDLEDFISITLLLSLDGNDYKKLIKLKDFINTNMKINGVEWKKISIIKCYKNPYNFSLKIISTINEKLISISQLTSILKIHKALKVDVLTLQTFEF